MKKTQYLDVQRRQGQAPAVYFGCGSRRFGISDNFRPWLARLAFYKKPRRRFEMVVDYGKGFSAPTRRSSFVFEAIFDPLVASWCPPIEAIDAINNSLSTGVHEVSVWGPRAKPSVGLHNGLPGCVVFIFSSVLVVYFFLLTRGVW